MKFTKHKILIAHLKERAFTPDGKVDLKQILLWAGLGIFGLFLAGILMLGLLIAIISIGLPNVHDLDKIAVAQSTTIYDREGNVVSVKHGGENREYINYDQMSPYVIDATVAIEDSEYWEHPGFNAKGILRAVLTNIMNLKTEQGGSTITQQYVKMAFLTAERSIIRKLKELVLAVQLEQAFDKKKILELYLNKIPYSNNAYGIEKASQIYFNKHAKDLNLAESALLASIPNLPSYYNPYREHLYSKLTKDFKPEDLWFRKIKSEADLNEDTEISQGLIGQNIQIGENQVYIQGRSDLVLKRMKQLGYITEQQLKDAIEETHRIQFKQQSNSIKYPHFTFYVLDQLEKKYGKEIVEQGGLKVYTTIDPKMEDAALKIVEEGALANEKKYNAKNAALVSIDPKTGQILAMVGSRNYDHNEIDGKENVALDYRQPGSSFKPFVYAQAFYNRFSPATVVFDTPLTFGSGDTPKNFDGSFHGPMTMREALAQSRNIPAIKAYYLAGEQKPILELAMKMGITLAPKTDPNHDFGWPLALGGAEVRLIDMVSAFSAFANSGVRHEPVAILKVENAKGEILEQWQEDDVTDPSKQVLDPQIAFLISSILSDTSYRLSPNLTIPNQINAGKTGTSNITVTEKGVKKYYPHDLWAMGYTTKLVTGVWTGNNVDSRDGYISAAADGVNVAAPIWKKYMTEVLKDTPSEAFPIPEGIKQITVSKASGKLPSENTPPDQLRTDYFASFSIPTEVDNSYTTIEIDTFCGKLANEFTPEEYRKKVSYLYMLDVPTRINWQQGADDWMKNHYGQTDPNNASVIFGPPPTESCSSRGDENSTTGPVVSITNPSNGASFTSGEKIKIDISITAEHKIDKVEYYLDGEMRNRTTTAPYQGTIRIPVGDAVGKRHTLEVKVFDNFGYVGKNSIDLVTGAAYTGNSP